MNHIKPTRIKNTKSKRNYTKQNKKSPSLKVLISYLKERIHGAPLLLLVGWFQILAPIQEAHFEPTFVFIVGRERYDQVLWSSRVCIFNQQEWEFQKGIEVLESAMVYKPCMLFLYGKFVAHELIISRVVRHSQNTTGQFAFFFK